MGLGITWPTQELMVDKVPLGSLPHDHAPESVGEVNLLPVDLPLAVGVEHELHNAVHRRAIALQGGLVAIVRAMQGFSEHAEIQVSACQALSQLSLCHDNEVAIE